MSIPHERLKQAAKDERAAHRQAPSELPIYTQIKENLLSRITSGEYKPGDRLPSENQLCKAYGTTRSTVRQALSQLVFEGIVTREPGRGSFVSQSRIDKFPIDTRECLSFEEQVELEGKSVAYQMPSYTIVQAPEKVAQDLGLKAGDSVFYLERLRMIDNRPVCLEQRYIHPSYGRQVTGEMVESRSAHSFVSEILGQRIPVIRVLVSAIVADKILAEKLSVPQGAALIVRDNWQIGFSGDVLMCGRSIFPGDIRTEYVLGHNAGFINQTNLG